MKEPGLFDFLRRKKVDSTYDWTVPPHGRLGAASDWLYINKLQGCDCYLAMWSAFRDDKTVWWIHKQVSPNDGGNELFSLCSSDEASNLVLIFARHWQGKPFQDSFSVNVNSEPIYKELRTKAGRLGSMYAYTLPLPYVNHAMTILAAKSQK